MSRVLATALGVAGAAVVLAALALVGARVFTGHWPWSPGSPVPAAASTAAASSTPSASTTASPTPRRSDRSAEQARRAALDRAMADSTNPQTAPPPPTSSSATAIYLHGDGAALMAVLHQAALEQLRLDVPDRPSCDRLAAGLTASLEPAAADELASAVPDAPLVEDLIRERRALGRALGECSTVDQAPLQGAVGAVELRLKQMGYAP